MASLSRKRIESRWRGFHSLYSGFNPRQNSKQRDIDIVTGTANFLFFQKTIFCEGCADAAFFRIGVDSSRSRHNGGSGARVVFMLFPQANYMHRKTSFCIHINGNMPTFSIFSIHILSLFFQKSKTFITSISCSYNTRFDSNSDYFLKQFGYRCCAGCKAYFTSRCRTAQKSD